MAVISLTITPSIQQVLPGVPALISISANISSLIFYTLDGTAPDTNSAVYTAPIVLPETINITLSVMAYNGTDSSDVITQSYAADTSQITTMVNDRLPHSTVCEVGGPAATNSLFPFGSNTPSPDVRYENPGDSGTTVYDQTKPAVSQGFDANGNPAVFTNKPKEFYQFNEIYSTTNAHGEVLPGVGNLPAAVEIIGSPYSKDVGKTSSSLADRLFDPRAMVIYQDTNTDDPTNPHVVMGGFMTLQNNEIYRDGCSYYSGALDQGTVSGSFVNRNYNPRTNMITNSYYDNSVGRWIFSQSPYQPTVAGLGDLSGIVFGRETGTAGMVFPWAFGRYRTLT